MEKWLGHDRADRAITDITDICSSDLPGLERRFIDWCVEESHYDQELRDKTLDLLIRREYDSAIRKAFIILKSRLASKFQVSRKLDGAALVNHIYGSNSQLASNLDHDGRQAMRDLLAGLFGIFRNKYGHEDVEAPWHEADAVIAMVNFALKRLDE